MLPAVKKTKREIELTNIITAIKELQGASFRLTSARSRTIRAGLSDISNHLQKMINDVTTIKIHLKKIYKTEKILYTDMERLYNNLEIVVNEGEKCE